MKADWSSTWKSSKQQRKQRKHQYNAPAHIKRKFISSHLDKKLKAKIGKRAVQLRKGDEVKIMRGKHKGVKGNVERIDIKNGKIYIEGKARETVAGNKVLIPFNASNVLVTSLKEGDKMRFGKGEKGAVKVGSRQPDAGAPKEKKEEKIEEKKLKTAEKKKPEKKKPQKKEEKS